MCGVLAAWSTDGTADLTMWWLPPLPCVCGRDASDSDDSGESSFTFATQNSGVVLPRMVAPSSVAAAVEAEIAVSAASQRLRRQSLSKRASGVRRGSGSTVSSSSSAPRLNALRCDHMAAPPTRNKAQLLAPIAQSPTPTLGAVGNEPPFTLQPVSHAHERLDGRSAGAGAGAGAGADADAGAGASQAGSGVAEVSSGDASFVAKGDIMFGHAPPCPVRLPPQLPLSTDDERLLANWAMEGADVAALVATHIG